MWISFSWVVDSCWQLLGADDNWNRKRWTRTFIYTFKVICVPNFSSLCWFLLWSNFVSSHQPLTADIKNLTDIFMCTPKFICVPNFSSLSWFLFSSTGISCWQLMTVDMIKSWLKFYVYSKVYLCAKFQLSRLIFIFLNCYQLSSAVDSCWQLMRADMKKITGLLM